VSGADPASPPGARSTWRELLVDAAARLAARGVANAPNEARWIVERASGADPDELALLLDAPVTQRGAAHLDAMLVRRLRGEPLQYVLGAWGFRQLDLAVDARALIPRPETEVVVDHVLAELDRARDPDRPARVIDLGTGSGAIALAVAFERAAVEVWATDVSTAALELARANLAGLGRAGSRVRLAQGDWFAGLPADLQGTVDLVVSNPPYIADGEALPPEVDEWEPRLALRAGPTGLEAYERIVAEAPGWLRATGGLVLEVGPHQADTVAGLARDAGLVEVRVHADLAGRDRVVVARRAAVALR
jgi:release factor glutamine methyltransferase